MTFLRNTRVVPIITGVFLATTLHDAGGLCAQNVDLAAVVESMGSYSEALARTEGVVELRDFEIAQDGDSEVDVVTARCEFIRDRGNERLTLNSTLADGTYIGSVRNDTYSAAVKRGDAAAGFQISNVRPSRGEKSTQFGSKAVSHAVAGVYAGLFSALDVRSLISKSSNAVIKNVSFQKNANGDEMCNFDFRCSEPIDRLGGIRTGHVSLVRLSHWVVHSAELQWEAEDEPSGVFTHQMTYGKSHGLTVPESAREERVMEPTEVGGIARRFVCIRNYSVQTTDKIAADTFRLTSFGLPEPDFSVTRSPTTYLLIASLGLLFLFVCFVVSQMRKKE